MADLDDELARIWQAFGQLRGLLLERGAPRQGVVTAVGSGVIDVEVSGETVATEDVKVVGSMPSVGETVFLIEWGTAGALIALGSSGEGGVGFEAEVYLSASQTGIAQNTLTAVSWSAEAYDPNGWHSSGSQLTVPTGGDGDFLLCPQVSWETIGSGVEVVVWIYKNAAATGWRRIQHQSAAGQYPIQGLTVPLRGLVAGDDLEVMVRHADSTSRSLLATDTRCALVRLA